MTLTCAKKTHGKLYTLPCAKKINTRQTVYFAVCQEKTHGKVFAVCQHIVKRRFCRVFFLPCVFVVAHGKVALCRVPDKKHTTKTQAHGKLAISGSE